MMKPLADITILVAEDERSVRMLMRVVLEAAGARVIEAENGAVALRLLDLHPELTALVTDVNMPILDGHDLVRVVRRRAGATPIVACTAADLNHSFPGMSDLVDEVVSKPFIPADLVRAIAAAIDRRRDHDSIAAS